MKLPRTGRTTSPCALAHPDRRYALVPGHDRFAAWIAACAPLLGLLLVGLTASLLRL